MYILIASMEFQPDKREIGLATMKQYFEQSAGTAGLLSQRLTADVHDPNAFMHIQEWESEALLQAHARSEVFHQMMGGIGTLLADTPVANGYAVSEKRQIQ